MDHRPPVVLAPTVVLLVSLAATGCGVHRKLKITEVQPNQVELYLDEPSDHRLNLTNMRYKWATNLSGANPAGGEIDLSIAGELRGGQFLIIFEDGNHTGAPAARNFQPSIPGIVVQGGYFPSYGSTPGIAMGVSGKHRRGWVEDKVSDTVTFGAPPRPPAYGAFTQDNTLNSAKPSGSNSISRAFNRTAAVDDDRESDWSVRPQSPGAPSN